MMKQEKIISIFAIVLFLAFLVLFAFLFVNCIKLYGFFDVDYGDLQYEQLTIKKVERITRYRGGSSFEIYFWEHQQPFEISNITLKAVNKKALEQLPVSTKVDVYYRQPHQEGEPNSICQLAIGENVILDLADYVQENRTNQLIGLIICPILIGITIFLVVFFAIAQKQLGDSEPLTEFDIKMSKFFDFAYQNKKNVMVSNKCYCYHCLSVIDSNQVVDYVDKGHTALCPKCGEMTLLPDCVDGVDENLMQQMHDYWFEDEDTPGDKF